jgi:hypothetical protein
MKAINNFGRLLLPMVVLFIAGCGGSSSSNSGTDPFSNGAGSNSTAQTTLPVTAPDPTVSLLLTNDLVKPTDLTKLPQVDANIGTVLLTATMLNVGDGVLIDATNDTPIGKGAPIPNQLVSFNVVAGPGTITYATPGTDKNGGAYAILTTGNVDYTTNVIVEASATVSGKIYRSYTQFQIVRGTGKIELSNEQSLAPYELPADFPVGQAFNILHQFSFLLTDSNGNPRVGVPVTLSVFSVENSGTFTPVFLDYSTTRTGSNGVGWFNAKVTLHAPGPGLPDSASVIYKARTNDPYPIINYKGSVYTVIQKQLSSASK